MQFKYFQGFICEFAATTPTTISIITTTLNASTILTNQFFKGK